MKPAPGPVGRNGQVTVVRIGVGQINAKVGDFDANLAKIIDRIKEASRRGVELLVFPEMAVTGFPTEDLSFRGSFMKASCRAVDKIAASLKRSSMVVIVGGIEVTDTFYKAAAVIHRGEVLGWARKRHLFCCGRFTEDRYFSAGERPLVIECEKFRAAVTLGDDFGYPVFPGEIELLINLWNEPFVYGRRPLRERMMLARSMEDAVAIVMVSPAGASDDMIFEGSSTIVDGFGEVLARGPAFNEGLVVADLDLRILKSHRKRVFHSSRPETRHLEKVDLISIPKGWPAEKKKPADSGAVRELYFKGPKEMFMALSIATRDFVQKNGCGGAILGVSGGIDSAVCALIAREAFGAGGVTAVSMPGPYTSKQTRKDAKKVAENLGVRFLEIPIKGAFNAFNRGLAKAFEGLSEDVTEENLQARIRGVILMALANKYHGMVLCTGNKSEDSVGYCTMYGDTVGGYAPLVDVYKTQVYEIAEWYNLRAGRDVIPKSVIDRAPTAELKEGQQDIDALPPYPELDRILMGFLEGGQSVSELIEAGEDPDTVYKVMRMLTGAEFKRRQAPIGPTVSTRPLSDLILPISMESGWWTAAGAKASKSKPGGKKK